MVRAVEKWRVSHTRRRGKDILGWGKSTHRENRPACWWLHLCGVSHRPCLYPGSGFSPTNGTLSTDQWLNTVNAHDQILHKSSLLLFNTILMVYLLDKCLVLSFNVIAFFFFLRENKSMFQVTLLLHSMISFFILRPGWDMEVEISSFFLWIPSPVNICLIAFVIEDCCHFCYLTVTPWVQRSSHIVHCLAHSMYPIYIHWLKEYHKLMFNMNIRFFEVYGCEKLL